MLNSLENSNSVKSRSAGKKPLIAAVVGIMIAVIAGVIVVNKKKHSAAPTVSVDEKVDLPVNTIPVEERPYISLTPDKSGHNLELSLSNAPKEGQLEYEILYNTKDAQEGGLGSFVLSATQPITKEILLGTRSAGGATTYHEGVTGGALTVTYNNTKLKEQFNFLRFDPADTTVTSSDLKFSAILPAKPMKKDSAIVVMKTFGLPTPVTTGKLVAGPYGYFVPDTLKNNVDIEMKLPAGTYTNAQIMQFAGGKWVALKTAKKGDDMLTASATPTGSVFIVTDQQ